MFAHAKPVIVVVKINEHCVNLTEVGLWLSYHEICINVALMMVK